MSKRLTVSLIVISVAFIISACLFGVIQKDLESTSTPGLPSEATATQTIIMNEDYLKNMSYEGIYDDPVDLVDGIYKGEPITEGGESRPTVILTDWIAIGDLDNDGKKDAAVLLAENSGGSGTFFYLSVVKNDSDTVRNVSTIFIGDRISPETLEISKGMINLKAAFHAEEDPLCCPSLDRHIIYELRAGEIDEIHSEDLGGQISTPLKDTSWTLVEIWFDGSLIDPGLSDQITAEFSKDEVTGFAGCNNYFSNYQVDNKSITLGPIGSTKMACGERENQIEYAYLENLASAEGFQNTEKTLEFLNADDEVVLRFESQKKASIPTDLQGEWYWLAYQDTAGLNNLEINDPEKYTLNNMEDGTVKIIADCNTASSQLLVDQSGITFSPGPMTLAECETGSHYQKFLSRLGDVVTYVFDEEGRLVLNLKMDAGNMIFDKTP